MRIQNQQKSSRFPKWVAFLLACAAAACGGGCGGGGSSSSSSPNGGSTGNGGGAPPAAVTNVRHNGVIHTGFLAGTAVTGTTLVEVKLDGGAFAAATGTTAWSYKLPTGTGTWKESSAHDITVRVTGASGSPTTLTPLHVRKGPNWDINGDGYEDLVIGAWAYNGFAGRAYVILSRGPGNLPATLNASAADSILSGGTSAYEPGNSTIFFGRAVAMGDVNGDGYADVVIGAPTTVATAPGQAFLFLSKMQGNGQMGLAATLTLADADTLMAGWAGGDYFGSAVAIGDVNGDGYADIAIGAPQAKLSSCFELCGAVAVFQGHSWGLGAVSPGASQLLATNADTQLVDQYADDFYGSSIAIADLNGDGFGEVLGGTVVPASGTVYIVKGAAGTIPAVADVSTGANSFIGGGGVAVGFVDGDDIPDVAMVNGNALYLWTGTGAIPGNVTLAMANSVIIGGDVLATVTIGDVNGDGYGDVLAGPYYNPITPECGVGTYDGCAYLFKGSSTGLAGKTSTTQADTKFVGTAGSSENLGIALVLTGLNGTGYSDAVIGAPIYGSFKGRVYVFKGSASGPAATVDAASADALFSAEAGPSANFGFALQ